MANLEATRPLKSNRDNTNNCSIGFDSLRVPPPPFVPRRSMTALRASNKRRRFGLFLPPPNRRRKLPWRALPRRARPARPPPRRVTSAPSRFSPRARAERRPRRTIRLLPRRRRRNPSRPIHSIRLSSIAAARNGVFLPRSTRITPVAYGVHQDATHPPSAARSPQPPKLRYNSQRPSSWNAAAERQCRASLSRPRRR